jgi:predicted PhzF superfamily epimerase YddE/YHI9
LHIHTPALEIPLAGHPLVGSAWFLWQYTGSEVKALQPVLAGEVESWQDAGLSWVRASIADAPDWQFVQLASAAEVEALSVPPAPEYDLHEFWAWEDEAAGRLRARVFGSRYGVPEDEATGSGALRLTGLLRRPLTIHQGKGSVVYARPAGTGRAEIGGRVVSDGARVI